jgi:hypothetical protein
MNIINTCCLYFIMFCHFLVVCFIVLVPFINSNYLLLLHSILVPFIMIHWLLNDNTCVLSVIETNMRKHIYGTNTIDVNDCFTCKLINPIYDFRANYNDYSTIIYFITIILWSISLGKLYYKYCTGEIRTIMDLFLVQI